MHPYELAIAIVAIVFTYKLIRLAMLRQPTRRDATANTDLNNRLAEVEERVRVLERIVTDDRHDLKQQFKDLES
jgi:hypothetical protein